VGPSTRIVLEVYSAKAPLQGLGEEVEDFMRGFGGGEAVGADVGDTVAVGVGEAGVGGVGEVGAEAVGGAESGALAQQDEGEAGLEEFADFVLEGDASVADDDDRGEGPAVLLEEGNERREEGRAVLDDGEAGEAVGEDEGDVARRGSECGELRAAGD